MFPSIWLVVASVVIYLGISGYLQYRATQKDQTAGAARSGSSPVAFVLSTLYTSAVFYFFTGNFPLQFLAIAIGLYAISSIVVWMIYLVSGVGRNRQRQASILSVAFFRQGYAPTGCVAVVLALVIFFGAIWLTYAEAERVDLSTDEGLFSVGLYWFTAINIFSFLSTNLFRGVRLLSKETPRQQRIEAFATAFQNYLLTAWSAIYPFYAFKQNLVQLSWFTVTLTLGLYLLSFAIFVLVPYGIGRTRFESQKNEVLQRLEGECRRIEIATRPDVPTEYQTNRLKLAERLLKDLFLDITRDRPFLRYLAARSAGGSAQISSPTQSDGATGSALVAAGTGVKVRAEYSDFIEQEIVDDKKILVLPSYADIAEKHLFLLPKLDYRLFVLAAIEEILTRSDDPAYIRSIAAEAEFESTRWRDRREGRSGALATIGILVSAIFPIAIQIYDNELRGAFNSIVSSISTNIRLPISSNASPNQ